VTGSVQTWTMLYAATLMYKSTAYAQSSSDNIIMFTGCSNLNPVEEDPTVTDDNG